MHSVLSAWLVLNFAFARLKLMHCISFHFNSPKAFNSLSTAMKMEWQTIIYQLKNWRAFDIRYKHSETEKFFWLGNVFFHRSISIDRTESEHKEMTHFFFHSKKKIHMKIESLFLSAFSWWMLNQFYGTFILDLLVGR